MRCSHSMYHAMILCSDIIASSVLMLSFNPLFIGPLDALEHL